MAAAAGLVHFAIFFADRPDGAPVWPFVAVSVALASAAGFLGGLLAPSEWKLLGVLACWGAPVSGLVLLVMGVHEGAAILALPLASGIAFSWAGALRGRRLRDEVAR